MPPRAESAKIIALFDGVFRSAKSKAACQALLAEAMDKSRVGDDHERLRYSVFRRLVAIVRTARDIEKLVQSHDQILRGISVDTEEDMSGYHHYYSTTRLFSWIRISRTVDDFLAIVNSKIPDYLAKKIAQKNGRAG